MSSSVVNLPTWLWIDPSIWHQLSVSASVGSVTATAVAKPVALNWSMGDGGAVSCDGPGVPFDPAVPAADQQSSCIYTYQTSSVGQPSTDGNSDDGAFQVQATVTWSVSWTATGAPGGGALPSLTTSSRSPMRVEQVESIDLENSVMDGAPFHGGLS